MYSLKCRTDTFCRLLVENLQQIFILTGCNIKFLHLNWIDRYKRITVRRNLKPFDESKIILFNNHLIVAFLVNFLVDLIVSDLV